MIEFKIKIKGENTIEDLLEIQSQVAQFLYENAKFHSQKTNKWSTVFYEQTARIYAYIGLTFLTQKPDAFLSLVEFIDKQLPKVLKDINQCEEKQP